MTDKQRIVALERAVRYLWFAWAEAEGEGQPMAGVFGPDETMRRYYAEMGETFREASPEIQSIIREVVGDRSQ